MVLVISWLIKSLAIPIHDVLVCELEDVWVLPFELVLGVAVISDSTRAQCEEGRRDALELFERVLQTRQREWLLQLNLVTESELHSCPARPTHLES